MTAPKPGARPKRADGAEPPLSFRLRIPRDIYEAVAAVAKQSRRSTNAEIVTAVEQWVRRMGK